MEKLINKIYKSRLFIYYLLPISIFVDCLNGYTQGFLNLHLPIGIMYRFSILFILFPCLLKGKIKSIQKITYSIIYLFIISLPIWFILNNIDIMKELESFSKVLYTFLVIIYFLKYGRYHSFYFLLNQAANYGLIVSLFIIFSFTTGISLNTYGEDYGFGVKSFFHAGNDVALASILSLIFNAIACYSKFNIYYIIRLTIVSIGCFLIGSRVGMLGCIIFNFIFLTYYFIFNKTKSKISQLRKSIFFVLTFFIIIIKGSQVFFDIYNSFDSYTLEKFTVESLSNARTGLVDGAKLHINTFDNINIMIGEGTTTLYKYVADFVGSESEGRNVEADYYEIIGSYGYLLGTLILLPYIFYILKSVIKWAKHKNFIYFSLLLFTSFFFCIAMVAGHAIKNVMIPPLYAICIYFLTNSLTNESFINKQQLSK